MAKVPTPAMSTCEEVAQLLGLPLARTVKCLMAWADGRVHMLLVRGDHMGNEVKIGKLPGMDGWRWASDAEIVEATGGEVVLVDILPGHSTTSLVDRARGGKL